MADAEYKYRLLDPASDEYRERPLLLQVDSTLMNLFAVLEVRRETPTRRGALHHLRQFRLYSFLFGLALVFLITASYVLTGDKWGLMLTPSPFQFGGPGGAAGVVFAANASTLKDYERMRSVVRDIEDKVEFSSKRRKPKLKDVVDSEPHLFSVVPGRFLGGLKNPCWYEEYHGNSSADPYQSNCYGRYSRRFRAVFQQLRASFREHLVLRAGRALRLRCLPYFYIIGQPKCGTTDLYDRLRLHPEVRFTMFKEPHWWTRKRFGLIRLSERRDRFPVEDYLDLFDQAAHHIQGNATSDRQRAPSQPDIIIGEASASTMWDNNAWVYVYDNCTDREPPFLVQDFVHALQPRARFIVMLRDPVERLYSDYLYFGISNKSAEDFHDKVSESLLLFQSCLTESSVQSCVYNSTVNQAMPVRLHVGLYIVFLLDWLSVFSPEQILVLRLEDHASNTKYTMNRVFHFLSLGPLSKRLESDITRNPASNTRRPSDRSLGPMLPATRALLSHFYRPFNAKLASVLRNDSFLWDSSASSSASFSASAPPP
ncbi:carbohydrate sulfotransferase 15 [Eucyclogobius newberryi]|uniref:carbohydrate sulfotransferase 15 n=1 Tax=Eucyclogobius newberryi TaxID=166745 RepID=UPI003B5C6A79